MGFYYGDKHVSEKNKRFMASLVMTSLLLSQVLHILTMMLKKRSKERLTSIIMAMLAQLLDNLWKTLKNK